MPEICGIIADLRREGKIKSYIIGMIQNKTQLMYNYSNILEAARHYKKSEHYVFKIYYL